MYTDTETEKVPNNGKRLMQPDKSLPFNEIIRLLVEINAKIDALQLAQASLRTDIVGDVRRILINKWKEDAVIRRERCW